MLFIDGTWVYSNVRNLARVYGEDEFLIDYGKLPRVLAQRVGEYLGSTEIDIVRSYLFGSFAVNYAHQDDEMVSRRLDFFDRLTEEWHYEVETVAIDYRGRRLRKKDRSPEDDFEPREKCVDIALATSMLYFAAIPYAYDIAIAVVGDRDYVPVLQHVRRLGKRVAIASIKGSCSSQLSDSIDRARVKDFDIIWIDDHLAELEQRFEKQQLECQSPLHRGDKKFFTRYQPRKGRPVYCPACVKAYREQQMETQTKFAVTQVCAETQAGLDDPAQFDELLTGAVSNLLEEKRAGFIRTLDKYDYYFNIFDLNDGLTYEEIGRGMKLDFQIKRPPCDGKAGAARNVRRHAE